MVSRAKADGVSDPLVMTLRLAVLLSSGLAPTTAWTALAEDGHPTATAAAVRSRAGGDVADVLSAAGGAWSDVAAVYGVAVESGAPLAETLRTVAAALRDAAEVAGDVRVALAEPAATARLLAWLPVVGVPLGIALGFDVVGILVGDPLGIGCLSGGAVLVVAAHVWSRRLIRAAAPAPGVPGLSAQMWAVALSAGASVDRARALIDARRPTSTDVERSSIEQTLDLAMRSGAPAAELLRAEAWAARHRARTEGRAAAARLSTRLLLPLGVCTLPAFLLLAVAPMMLGVLRGTTLP